MSIYVGESHQLESLLAAGLLLRDLRTAHGVHRRQLLLIFGGFIIGFVGLNDFILTGAIDGVPSYVRTSPFTLLAAVGLWTVALFRHQLFGLVPVSRRTVVETIPDPVIAIDGNDSIVDVNPAAKRLFEASTPAEGTKLREFWRDYPLLIECYRSSETNAEVELDCNGTTRHFSMGSEPIDDGRTGTVVVLRDVTELKHREHQLELKNEQLERLASVVSHDLQTPLSTAEKTTTLLRADLEKPTEDVEQSLEDLDAVHRRLREFADHLPQLARESTDVEEPIECELATVAEVAWNVVDTDRLTLQVEENRTLKGDPRRLQQLFENLFRNVVEHAVPNAESASALSMDTAQQSVSNSNREETLTTDENVSATTVRVGTFDGGFFVADDGPGIAPSRREDIFEYGMGTGDGSGFGLAIVRTIVEAHGWRISVTESQSGGARFEIQW